MIFKVTITMISFLFINPLSYFPFKSPVVEVNQANWVTEVSNYVKYGICFCIFVKKHSPKTNAIVSEFFFLYIVFL